MGNAIPERSRQIVRDRDNQQCQRCGHRGNEWHHRRRRGVKTGHDPHCPCNGVLLCGDCHRWVHANPEQATREGFILPTYENEPWTVPLLHWLGGWQLNDCEGSYSRPRTVTTP